MPPLPHRHFLDTDGLSRRALLKAASAAGIALPLGLLGAERPKAAEPKAIKLGWFPNAACLSPIAAAVRYGIFTKHNLNVELINFAGSTDQLLEAISTAKADASVGMALRWLKPLEQGFDVRITTGTHGGCLRLLGAKEANITEIEQLRGKVVAVSDMASPAKNFFSILLSKRGIDPVKEVDWRAYPADLLATAVEKGEAQALASQDPDTYRFLKKGNLVEVATNLSAEYAHRTCCVLGIRGSLLREDRPTAAALTRALLEAQDLTAAHPEQTAEAYSQYVANASAEDIVNILKSHTHGDHALGADLRNQIVQYTEELKLISVIKPHTDAVRFAEKITEDVLA
jgi:NitT/TauT family transport system substrate-binding protein